LLKSDEGKRCYNGFTGNRELHPGRHPGQKCAPCLRASSQGRCRFPGWSGGSWSTLL